MNDETLREAMERLVHRTPFTPTAIGIDVHLTFEQMAEQRAALSAPAPTVDAAWETWRCPSWCDKQTHGQNLVDRASAPGDEG